MKKSVLAATLLVAISAGAAIASQAPGTGVVGSAHDMNTVSGLTDDQQGRVCAFCHTPHHALVDPTGEQQPLWSHKFTETASYKPYASPTLNATIDDPLVGPSRLCMSCHDGVIAADQHYGSTGVGGTNGRLDNDNWNGVAIGLKGGDGVGNLSNDHPIGFIYSDVSDNDTGIFAAASRSFKGNANTSITVESVLTNGFMTCATCHDVHNKDNVANQGGANYFVYGPQEGSQLCLTCHAKGSEAKI